MEVVLLLVAIIGIALIAVPRLQARRAGAASRRRSLRRKRARVVTRAAAVTPVAASWTPPASEEDAWDDDLGWEGQDATPATRDEWNKWRDAQSPETESPELPSVDRWRERATSGDDRLEDDDGLGWEGSGLTPPNRNGHREPAGSPPSAGDIAAARHAEAAALDGDAPSRNGVFAASNGHADLAPAPTGLASPGNGAATGEPSNGAVTRTFSRPDELAAPAAASNGGGSRGLDWLTPGARANPEATPTPTPTPAPAPAPRRRRSLHPVVLVALYAAAGIGAVVLASTVLLGGGSSSPSKPAPKATAAPPATTPASTPAPTPTVDTSAQEATDAAAAKSAERKQIAAFHKERAAARHAEAVAITKARAAAKRRKEAQQRKNAAGSGGSPPTPTQPTTPQSSGGGRSGGSGGGGGGRTCEFCIG
jgi:hypothetical protein